MSARWGRGAVALLLTVSSAAACSNSQSAINKEAHPGKGAASQADGVQQITVTTGSDYRFHPSTITAHTGPVRVVLENKGPGAPHDLQVSDVPGADVPLARAGTTTEQTFTLTTPGTYRFVCSIHVSQGQTGTLVVKPAP